MMEVFLLILGGEQWPGGGLVVAWAFWPSEMVMVVVVVGFKYLS